MKWLTFFMVMLAGNIIPLNSQVLHVPEEYGSIKEAISDATDGDTILVNQGIYFENVSFAGKNIVLASYYLLTRDFEDVRNTVINGGDSDNPDSASCVMFYSGEDSTAVLEGFTLTAGSGTKWIDPQFPTYTWRSGGGIFICQSSPTIRNNFILRNEVYDLSGVDGASGGGICTYGGNPVICGNIVWKNTARYGAGVVIDYSGCTFANNLVAWNACGSTYGGGGFWMIGNSDEPILIENNTIVNNEAVENGLGGAMYLWSTHLSAYNNIIWGNIQSAGDPVYIRGGAIADISWSDVEGGHEGEGNIDADPLFQDSVFLLKPNSPCIDHGHPESLFNDPEDLLNPGFALWPAQGTTRNDMGAFGGPLCLRIGLLTGGVEEVAVNQLDAGVFCIPNPFYNQVEIGFTLESYNRVNIVVFDQHGRIIHELFSGYLSNGSHSIIWDGKSHSATELPAGVYLCRLTIGNAHSVNKLFKTH